MCLCMCSSCVTTTCTSDDDVETERSLLYREAPRAPRLEREKSIKTEQYIRSNNDKSGIYNENDLRPVYVRSKMPMSIEDYDARKAELERKLVELEGAGLLAGGEDVMDALHLLGGGEQEGGVGRGIMLADGSQTKIGGGVVPPESDLSRRGSLTGSSPSLGLGALAETSKKSPNIATKKAGKKRPPWKTKQEKQRYLMTRKLSRAMSLHQGLPAEDVLLEDESSTDEEEEKKMKLSDFLDDDSDEDSDDSEVLQNAANRGDHKHCSSTPRGETFGKLSALDLVVLSDARDPMLAYKLAEAKNSTLLERSWENISPRVLGPEEKSKKDALDALAEAGW